MIFETSLDFFFLLLSSLHSRGFPVVSVILSNPSDSLKYGRFIIFHLLREIGPCISIVCGFCQTGSNVVDVLITRYI